MEVREAPPGGTPAWAKIIGIQFGLMTTADVIKMSVTVNPEPNVKPKDLMNARLGLPTASRQCLTCNGITSDQCQGHFGHIILPLPVFHPNHVEFLVRLLRKICLNCGRPRIRKRSHKSWSKESSPVFPVPAPHFDGTDYDFKVGFNNESKKRKRTLLNTSEQGVDDWPRPRKDSKWLDNVVVLSSDDSEEELGWNSKVNQKVEFYKNPSSSTSKISGAIEIYGGPRGSVSNAAEEIPSNPRISTRKRKSGDLDGFTPKSTPKFDVVKDKGAENYRESEKSAENGDKAAKIGKKSKTLKKCKYCSASSRERGYPEPEIRLHVTSQGTSKADPLSWVKAITMSVNPDDQETLADDFWNFVEGSSRAESSVKKGSRYLLPSEALKILKKVPEDSIAFLGMKADVARPEALILECIPIPPNCSRLQEDGFGSSGTNIGFKIGVDRATKAFERLLRKIQSIKTARFSKPVFQAALKECSVLQAFFQLYLREKGAPKAALGEEKRRVDLSGRYQKSGSRWSLDWMKKNIIGKKSGYSARNVVTGDPFLSVEEIGVPLDVAKHVTCSERVTEFNRSTLQRYVEIGQTLGDSRVCGAVRIVRDGERREVTRKTEIDLEIGDIVHRHLKEGDLVFINRPPSLHRHSLLALKAHIHKEGTWTINPAICTPLHADFDGDCLHVFVPQTEESKAELQELMTVPAQILSSSDESTIVGLSQDHILAAYLLTSSPIFVTKEEIHQLGLWTTKQIPVPTVVKSPKGDKLWTGKQVIDLTIPEKFSFQSSNKATVIQDGEMLCCGERPNWLASTRGLVRIIASANADAAVKHLDCSESILREWLLNHGFSVSLKDFYAVPDRYRRRKMKQEMEECLKRAKCMALRQQFILDKKNLIQKKDKHRQTDSRDPIARSGSTRTSHDLQHVDVSWFRRILSQIGETFADSIPDSNSLLAMVRSGSKGSNAKVMQQIGNLGIQVVSGDKLLSVDKNPKLAALASVMGHSSDSELQDVWDTRGLVKSSLLDGLEPHEFFTHAISARDVIFRQSQEISGPGELFKMLMLFLRDVHIGYDGTVRNRGGLELIQFNYDGAKSLILTDEFENTNSREEETVLPGEPVGILAATAISQPAYQIMLESSAGIGFRKIRPLDLLQESMYPRSDSKLKASDRKSVLRLSRCECGESFCEERRILSLQAELQPVTVEMLATETAVEYASDLSELWETFDFVAKEINQAQLIPWIGHIQLDQMLLVEKQITPAMILKKLESNVGVIQMSSGRRPLGRLIFNLRDVGGCCLRSKEDLENPSEREKTANVPVPCLHFSLVRAVRKKGRTLRTKRQKADETTEMLNTLQNVIIPMILQAVVKGSEKVESASVVWENHVWSPPQIRAETDKSDGELVLEVTVKEVYCTCRGMPWKIISELCLVMMDYIDWKRSSPYSIQEIRTIFGVDAAQDVLTQRLGLAAGDHVGKKHLKLIADLLAHSGEIHGLTAYGYKDWMRNLQIPIPFTAGVFRAPMKHFMDGARKGASESFKGVLASSVFGERVPAGTGTDFTVNLNIKPHYKKHLKSKVEPMGSCSTETEELAGQSIDVLECLTDLESEIAAQYPPVAPSAHVDEENNACAFDLAQVR